MDRILVSACLLGRPVRYNGTNKASCEEDVLRRWQREGRIVPVCPEVAVGFPTPRPPAEICADEGSGATAGAPQGGDVLTGSARVVEDTGADVSDLYLRAARSTVQLAERHRCRYAVLTDGSPSCGSTFIYDGTFTGRTRSGAGTTTAALREAGIAVWPETAIGELDALLNERAEGSS
ncbi:MAG: DUF523 domain-containing protein [Pseudomonadota bacterium]